MKHKNKKLTDLCHDLPCMADFDHECNGPSVPCHANDLMFGHGAGLKSPDHFIAACCPDAHDYIDGRKGGWEKEDKRYAWLRAYIKTQNAFWENGKVRVA